ncbi:MAG: hypothetical protein Q7V00_01645 [Sulfurimicrobium sp.]|nr:hypothetical protein [Sulfurimicrobium sp.]MDP1704586.1 hypothetical protein [Sulfurimicrobium sp.]MDP2199670.1 hypothetical protein [Sulfurimicrobium sp.]MDP3686740.1 hypothetical protein [Sulfurimicrobium sp.]
MLNWFTERTSPSKQNPQAKMPRITGVPPEAEECLSYSSYRPDQGIEVQELSMEEFLRVYKQG